MRQLEYDIKLAATIKAFRELRHIKQFVISQALNMEQCTYSRIEQGKITITPGQLKIISNVLSTSNFQILAIVEAEDIINTNHTTLSDILLKFVLMFEDSAVTTNLTEAELEIIIAKIKTRHKQLLQDNSVCV